jgi:hypothetical protein
MNHSIYSGSKSRINSGAAFLDGVYISKSENNPWRTLSHVASVLARSNEKREISENWTALEKPKLWPSLRIRPLEVRYTMKGFARLAFMPH